MTKEERRYVKRKFDELDDDGGGVIDTAKVMVERSNSFCLLVCVSTSVSTTI